jgi:transcriptional regulator with XRE-family HTH domain
MIGLSSYQRFLRALAMARKTAGLTQAQVAQKLKRPQSFVSKYEQGERRLDVVEFVAVCRALDIDAHEILDLIMGRQ